MRLKNMTNTRTERNKISFKTSKKLNEKNLYILLQNKFFFSFIISALS